MTLLATLRRDPPRLEPGHVVAYDYLHSGEHWQWTLGTVVSLTEYTAVVEQWGIHEGNHDTLKSVISNEVAKEMKRMKIFQDQLSAARDKLAAIRSENEDRVSAARSVFDAAREDVEGVDEVHMREVTALARPSPVAVAVLKAVLAVAKNDPTINDCLAWNDIQMEYRKPDAVLSLIHADIAGHVYPAAETIFATLGEARFSSVVAERDSEAISTLHKWVLSALAYQQAHSRLTSDMRVQAQNVAIGGAITSMKACRMKIVKLKEELSRGCTSATRGQVMSFTRTSVQTTIPCSAVISVVPIDSAMSDCVLTDDEVDAVLDDAKSMRFQLKDELQQMTRDCLETTAELHCLAMYTAELEEKRMYLLEHHLSNMLRSRGDEVFRACDVDSADTIKELRDDIDKLGIHDERWLYDDGPAVTTKHSKSYNGKDWVTVLENKPEEVLSTFKAEQALACHVPDNCIENVTFSVNPDGLHAVFEVRHPVAETTRLVEKRLKEFPPRAMERLHRELQAPKVGLDHAIVETCRALDLAENNFRGFGFAEFIEELAGRSHLGDKDAYESEIGDLLMLLDKIHSENRSLQYTLEKSAEEFRRQTATTMREQEALRQRNSELSAEIDRLRELVKKLKELTDNQADELELFKLQKNQANQMRTQRNLSTFKGDNTAEPLYCVTLDELHEQMAQCEEAEKEIARLQHQLEELQEAYHNVVARLNETTEERDKMTEEIEQLKRDLRQAQDEVEKKNAECAETQQNLERLGDLLDSVKLSEKEALDGIEARDRDIQDLQTQLENAISDNKATLAALQDKEKENEDLRRLIAKQGSELASHRDKRRAAHETRSLEPTLQPIPSQCATPEEFIDPDTIAAEPLLSVTMDEYSDHRQRCNQLQQENDVLRQQLQQAYDDMETFNNQLQEAAAENKSIAEHMRSKHDALTQAQNEIERLFAQNSKLEKELDQKTQENQRSAKELENLNEAIKQKAAEIKTLANENQQKDAEIDRLMEEAENISRELEQKCAENEKLAEELEQKCAENEKLAEELEQKCAENERLAEELQEKAAENDRGLGELEQKNDELSKLKDDIERLAEELEQKNAENEKLAEELEQKCAENEKLAEELEQKCAENEKLAEELEQKNAENERLAEELEQKCSENRKLADELDTLLKDLECMKGKNEELSIDLEKAVAEKEKVAGDARLQMLEFEAAKSALQSRVDQLERSLLDVTAEKDEAVSALEGELLDILVQLKGVNGVNVALEALMADMDKELKFLRAHCELWTDPVEKKNQVVTRHVKVFDGNGWEKLLRERPQALMAAFVLDSANACHVPGDQISEVSFFNEK
ncbi:Flagellar attachment zone protein 1 [Trypanosoma grayi]|uniref:Flagellar attachment zone protein 1 n=1 Tax=Trypanosoma grayi TaxID=71804 RepID=UPI0004F47367|nr:Flagellar attachment zone protein 1 [Trypanosoma grayi]KEG11850.1 Flagellar attachment zone protein 1 [Trypanosoma grayi]